MSKLLKQIARNVRRYRKKKRWKQAKLARTVGYNQSTISVIERGRAAPGLDLLERIASSLGVAPWQLLGEGISPGELRHLPGEIQRLLQLAESSDPYLVRLARDLTQLVGKHIDLAQKKGRRRRSPRA